MMEALDLKVEWLHRVSYGPIRLADMAEGRWRRLTPREVDAIHRLHGPAR
jgi:16S rRNA U516 pseudouridylate synthase RsuA-like enzyme